MAGVLRFFAPCRPWRLLRCAIVRRPYRGLRPRTRGRNRKRSSGKLGFSGQHAALIRAIWARGPRRKEESRMRRQIGLLWIVGSLGLLGAAAAQTPSSSNAGAAFDGTYRIVSSARVNKGYVTRGGQMGQCPNRTAGPLTIAQGQARYTTATGRQLEGTWGRRVS